MFKTDYGNSLPSLFFHVCILTLLFLKSLLTSRKLVSPTHFLRRKRWRREKCIASSKSLFLRMRDRSLCSVQMFALEAIIESSRLIFLWNLLEIPVLHSKNLIVTWKLQVAGRLFIRDCSCLSRCLPLLPSNKVCSHECCFSFPLFQVLSCIVSCSCSFFSHPVAPQFPTSSLLQWAQHDIDWTRFPVFLSFSLSPDLLLPYLPMRSHRQRFGLVFFPLLVCSLLVVACHGIGSWITFSREGEREMKRKAGSEGYFCCQLLFVVQ